MTFASTRAALAGLAVVSLLSVASAADPANWPRWRGPNDAGSTEAGAYPVKFDANTSLLWKVTLPGKGCSTPIVWEKHIFVTAPIEGKDAIECYDWDGKPLWQTAVGPERKGKAGSGSGCNPSPATDGQHLYAYFKSGNLAGLDLDGKLLWKTNLQERYGKDSLYWDIGTSPVLTKKHVVIAVMHSSGSYLVAFDKLTGDVAWKEARNYVTPTENDHSYTTPIVLDQGGREALLVWGAEHLTAHDAETGKVLWTVGGFNLNKKKNWVCVASPVIAGGLAIVPYGRGSELHGIRLNGAGDVTATNRVWQRMDTGSFCPTPAEYKGHVYILKDHGEVECINPVDGTTLWKGALPKKGAAYYSSPTLADGKLYAAREDGMLFVAKVDGNFELLSENAMGEKLIAAPVPVGNRLLVRGEEHLFCVGEK